MDIPGHDLNPWGMTWNASNLRWAYLASVQLQWRSVYPLSMKKGCVFSLCMNSHSASDI